MNEIGNDYLVVLSTCPDTGSGKKIARELVESGYVACVNILPGALSIYKWQGAIEESEECLLLIKTSGDLFQKVSEIILRQHPYECPELVALPIEKISDAYQTWLGTTISNQ